MGVKQVANTDYSSAMKMEVTRFTKTSVEF